MLVTIGKYVGESMEVLVLKEPAYIKWLLGAEASGKLLAMKSHAASLIKKFDAKPLLTECHAKGCSEVATTATVYLDNLVPYWWCANCDPYQTGANAGKLQPISTYLQALVHVNIYCRGRKSDTVEIIRYLAQAKGMSKKVSEKAAQQFFA